MRMGRLFRMLAMLMTGGMVLQATAGCQETLAPILAELAASVVSSFVLAALSGTTV